MKILTAFLFLVLASPSYSQSKVVTGMVIDSFSNEPVVFATVYDIKNDFLFQADFDGRFSIILKEGESTNLYVNVVGYPRKVAQIFATTDTIVIFLKPGMPMGINGHLAAREYYKANKTQIDSLDKIYDSYDLLIQKLISAKPK